MKSKFFLLASLLSLPLAAQLNLPSSTTSTPPKLKLGVYDMSVSPPKDIGLTYSRSNASLRLCWTAFDMPFSPNEDNLVIQVFTAPNNQAKFIGEGHESKISNEGRTTTLTHKLPSYQQQWLQQCWHFEPQDPIGTYQLRVQINQTQFDPLEFKITK